MSKTGEILTKFPARYTADQKQNFREWLYAQAEGHSLPVAEVKNKRYTDVILGDCNAPVLIAAHYDTACRSFISVKSEIGGNVFHKTGRIFREALASIFLSSKPNPNNYNDNTSGVSALMRFFPTLKKEPRIALAFLDGEEDGSCGAKLLAKTYPNLGKNLVINLDCIGFGDTFGILYYKSTMKTVACSLASQINEPPFGSFTKKIGMTFATDAQTFSRSITIASFKRGRNVWYFPHIHTPKDKILQEENLVHLTNAMVEWLQNEFLYQP